MGEHYQSAKVSDGEEREKKGAGDWLISGIERLGVKFCISVQKPCT